MTRKRHIHGIETPSRMTFESYGVKYTWETDHSDLVLSEVIEAFKKLLTAHGFDERGVLEGMRDYAEEELEILDSLNDCNGCMCTEIPEEDITLHHVVMQEKHTNEQNEQNGL